MSAKRTIKAGAESQHKKPEPRLKVEELRDKLWSVGSPFPLSAYVAPLSKIAAELASRLERELATSASRASTAADLEYADCAAFLMRVAPRIYGVLAEIRGLALVKDPTLTTATSSRPPQAEKETLPGEALEYESLRLPTVVPAVSS